MAAYADEDEYVFDVGLGPVVQLFQQKRATGTYNTRAIDWTSPSVGVRYGFFDFERVGSFEAGVVGSYSAEDDALFRGVEWEDGKVGDVLQNYQSWRAGAETRWKYGTVIIPYATLGAGWHRLSVYEIDFVTPSGLRIRRYASHTREKPYAQLGAGLEWRFSDYWSASLDTSFLYDLGVDANPAAIPIRAKFSYYMQD